MPFLQDKLQMNDPGADIVFFTPGGQFAQLDCGR